jgi:uncharacterized membrane protein
LTTLVFFIIDILWLGLISKNLYQEKIGQLLKEDVNWTAAILFYLFFIVGMLFFVIYPALVKRSWKYALFVGIFFGMTTYATYDMTNLATMKDWSVLITVVDILWGSFLCGATSLIVYSIMSKWGGQKDEHVFD